MNNFKRQFIKLFPILAKYIRVNYGLLPDDRDDRDDIMGASSRFDWKVIKEDGDWTKEWNEIAQETQFNMDCTGHGISNIIDMMMKAKGIDVNTSEAYINGMAGTSRTRGNSMRTVLESIRKNGVVPESAWEQKNRWKIIPSSVIEQGKAWLKDWNFGYDGVWATKKMLDEALKYSPLYVGGYAWYRRGMLYYSVGNPNHCFTIIKSGIAGDSYNPLIKHLADDFKLYYVKRIFIGEKPIKWNQAMINNYIKNRKAKYVMRVENKGQLYELSSTGLKHKLSDEFLTKKLEEAFAKKEILPLSEKDFSNLKL